jgi:Brp/Blh family beta-carotene 15,15'-monooxygenase
MEKIRQYILLLGVILALVSVVAPINQNSQLVFFIVIILLTGVPHGSLDFFVEKQIQHQALRKLLLANFLIKYLLNMLLYGIVWWLLPTVALALFIGLTAYHFGEIDWPIRKYPKLDAVLYTLYGFQLIVFIITSHIAAATPILQQLVQQQIPTTVWLQWGNIGCIASGVGLVIQLILLAVFYKKIGWRVQVLQRFLVQSIVLIAIIYILPLYLSFGFYFGIWHSFLSFQLIHKQMQLTNNATGWATLIKKALPFTIIAWLGIAALIVLQTQTPTQWLAISNLFVGIAILTLPHLQVFTKIKLR